MKMYESIPPLVSPVCRLILGTSFGGSLGYPEVARLFDAYVAHGGNCFDTALVYYDSEHLLGRWMRERDCRGAVTVVAKVAHPVNETPRVTPECIRADLEQTLSALDTEFVDVLMLHRDDPSQPPGPILDELERLRRSGAIRAYAASNWTIERLEESARYAKANGAMGFAASSVYYSLAVPTELPWPGSVAACDPVSEAWYGRTRMPLLAWSALGFGYFGGLETGSARGRAAARDVPHDATDVDPDRVFASPINVGRRSRAVELAKRRGTTATQIALAWVLRQPLNVFAVAGPRNEEEVRLLLGALALVLTEDEAAFLSAG